jgi:hypothetical protein
VCVCRRQRGGWGFRGLEVGLKYEKGGVGFWRLVGVWGCGWGYDDVVLRVWGWRSAGDLGSGTCICMLYLCAIYFYINV